MGYIVQGHKEGQWEDVSTEWRDRKPTKKEALGLFKGVKSNYDSIRLVKTEGEELKVLWEDKELLNNTIPIESVRD